MGFSSKLRLSYGWINAIIITSSCIIGYFVGNIIYDAGNPPWLTNKLKSVPENLIAIENIEISSSLEDPTGDILFVSDASGTIFSNKLFENTWNIISPDKNLDSNYIKDCTSERLGPTKSHSWDNPPLDMEVIDSAGVIFERPVSIIVRCYVLLEDGSIEVWVHPTDFGDMFIGIFFNIIYCLIGGVIGKTLIQNKAKIILSKN